MPAQIPCLHRMALRAAAVLVPVLLTANTTAGAGQCLGSEPPASGTVMFGNLGERYESSVELSIAKVDFMLLSGGIVEEEHDLKVFEIHDALEDLPDSLQHPELIHARHFHVISQDPGHERQEFVVPLQPSIISGLGTFLFAIEMSVRQLREAELILFFQQTEQGSTYFSMDGGSKWCQLGEMELACLMGAGCGCADSTCPEEMELACLMGVGCGSDGSTYYRIHVTPE